MAWSQSSVMLPCWYGTGSAFQRWIGARPESEDERVEILHALYQRWPFFRSVLSNMAQERHRVLCGGCVTPVWIG